MSGHLGMFSCPTALTKKSLGANASNAQVAQAWQAVYAANRKTIGSDPNVIRPGQVLVLPGGG